MDKYLVFRLEKEIPYAGHGHQVRTISPCFELVKEFEIKDGSHTWAEADDYAMGYSLRNKVRTVVIKGAVFG